MLRIGSSFRATTRGTCTMRDQRTWNALSRAVENRWKEKENKINWGGGGRGTNDTKEKKKEKSNKKQYLRCTILRSIINRAISL